MPEANADSQIERAARAIASADALLIGAGAGMGVDSGLPDFRGNKGFWRAYPSFQGRSFENLSNPIWFKSAPSEAWAFYGQRMNLYRDTTPHRGFEILRRWGESKPSQYFVFTSNVDGHFQKAGFDSERVLECHGSIHHLQCSAPCAWDIWPADDVALEVDLETMQTLSPMPQCIKCDSVARPNILMFGDFEWHGSRSDEQQKRYDSWIQRLGGGSLATIEIGAGENIPTVRHECEERGTLIRINPADSEVPPGGISIAMPGLEALLKIDAAM